MREQLQKDFENIIKNLKLSQKDMSEFMKLFFEARELGIKKHLK